MDNGTCTKCRTTKPRDKFARDASKTTGHKTICKACDNARCKHYYATGGKGHTSCAWCSNPVQGRRFCNPLCAENHAWERREAPIRLSNCITCHVTFAALRRGSYCSVACKPKPKYGINGPKTYPPRTCAICGTEHRPTGFYQKTCGDPVCIHLQRGRPASEPIRYRLAVVYAQACDICSDYIHRTSRPIPHAVCSGTCKARRERHGHLLDQTRNCPECGTQWISQSKHLKARFCSDRCARRARKRTGRHTRRARIKRAPRQEAIDMATLAARDGWRCHICKRKVTRKTWSHDHLIPLSYGGDHTYENVALAHNKCNALRGARGDAQLRLTG